MSSMSRALKRLLTMDRAEVAARVATGARREAGRVRHAIRPPSWKREQLADALDESVPALAPIVDSLRRRDWQGAHRALERYFAERRDGFVIAPVDRPVIRAKVDLAFPGAARDAAQRADAIVAGRFDLLGYRGLTFERQEPSAAGLNIDWHLDPVHRVRASRAYWNRVPYLSPSCGDHKIIWELNRHQWFLALGRAYWLTGECRYREACLRSLASWMADNPPLTGINWASMLELGLRSISWIWALVFFAEADARRADSGNGSFEDGPAAPWTVDLLLGLHRQLSLVEQNLSTYFSPNTHLLGEALALYVAGRVLPELRRARRWEAIGRRTLIDQIARQIHPDGGHVELSSHYHRYTLDFFLLALAVARRTGDPASALFGPAVLHLARFARAMADSNGWLPQIGDDDGGMLLPICGRDCRDVRDSLALAAHLVQDPELALNPRAEEVIWMGGDLPPANGAARSIPSIAFDASGYCVCRSPRGDHMVVDVGPHGFLNGGHAHADALSLTLSVAGRPLLIDPGTGCYTVNRRLRERFRSSAFHNTLTIDGRSQSQPDGPFHWSSTAASTLHAWRSLWSFDYVEASHDGYRPLAHRRTILARPGCWLIVDRVIGEGVHRIERHWHLDPEWRVVEAGTGRVRADHPAGTRAWVLSDDPFQLLRGDADEDLGWCAPVYGQLVPTTTLRTSWSAALPMTAVTAIVDTAAAPALERLTVTADGQSVPLGAAFRLSTAEWTETILIAPPGSGTGRAAQRLLSAGGIESDARMLSYRVERETSAADIVFVDGRTVRESDRTVIDLAEPAPVFRTTHRPAALVYAGGSEV